MIKKPVYLLLPIFFTLLISHSVAQPSQRDSIKILPGWEKIDRGIDFKKVSIYSELERVKAELRLYRFKPAFFEIRVLCSKDYGHQRTDVKTLAKLTGSVAIINSSYFDVQGNPIAYLKCNGKVVNSRKATHSLYSGVFFVRKGSPHIVHSSSFHPAKDVSDAVQVGPRLISKGKNTIGLKNINAVHHRSGIALDREGNLIIYATGSKYGGMSWNNLRQILKMKEIGGLEALNLDGGGSTQMYISTGNHDDYIRGSTGVPSAIAFFYKK